MTWIIKEEELTNRVLILRGRVNWIGCHDFISDVKKICVHINLDYKLSLKKSKMVKIFHISINI